MKLLAAIDSFKGSIGSQEANEIVKQALPQHEVETFPIADGGEGTVEALVALLEGKKITESITGPNKERIQGVLGWVEKDRLAIVEVAEGAGITKVPTDSLDPTQHTSYGVGEQIRSALDLGAKEIIIGLGGSATVDGGIGLLQALGVEFYDDADQLLPILPIHLAAVKRINLEKMDSRLRNVAITVASDVNNPLCGSNGATYVFGPQKGILEEDLEEFDQGMKSYQEVVNKATNTHYETTLGAGAAGGIGFALYSFLNASFESGLHLLAEKGHLAEKIDQVDMVITGEGKFDTQSLSGKVPIGISRLAKEKNIPVIIFCGSAEGDKIELPEENIAAIIPIIDQPMTLETAIKKGPELLNRAVKRTFHLIALTD
ncbi:glycerate kinase [Desemzia sp. RIT804]|uniref:glycerate kinase family protein n=1 Tax=Desemzia sp. RIT 804 TaxID=2810209 RepID=UPI00194EF128|nr:glycerate kinase [Desemzia sp. RIT 804]